MMKSFPAWLYEIDEPADAGLVALKAFATANATRWPYWDETPRNYIYLIEEIAPPAERAPLMTTLTERYAQWKATEKQGGWQLFKSAIVDNFGQLALVAFGVVFALLLYGGLSPTFLATLSSTEQVRGIITFFFVLATTSIIILFALSIFWMKSSAEVTERFKSAKDLLTIVIGVLGTIMGFYFGTTTSEGTKLSASALTPALVRAGETVTITGTINGGVKPYKYSVAFTDPAAKLDAAQIKALNFEGDSAEGAVSHKVIAPNITESLAPTYVLTATDSKNAKITSSGTLYLEPKK